MYQIMKKRRLNSAVTLMEVLAPEIAKKAQAGQFIILRIDEQGERVPLTINDFNPTTGTITVIFQVVGGTTQMLDKMEEGEFIRDFTGPLGVATQDRKSVV